MTQLHSVEETKSVERIRVAHIVLTLDIGGAEVLISRMVRAMLDTQYQPYVICLDGGGALVEDIRAAGIEVDILSRQPGLLDRQCLSRVVDLLKAKEIQLIHSHNFEAHFYSVLAAKLARINKVIHTQHGMPLPYNWKKSLLMPLLGSLVGKFVGVSDSVSTYAREKHWVSTKKLSTILNGVDTNLLKPDDSVKQTVRAELGIDPSAFVAVCVARVADIKDHQTLLAGFHHLLKSKPDARLVVVGDGPNFSDVRSYVETNNLKEKILLIGESGEVPKYLKAADAFVLTSLSEGISVAILEGMSCGLVPVVTNVGGNPSIITEGLNGYLVPTKSPEQFAEKLSDLIDSSDGLQKMSVAARERVIENFSQQSMLDSYLSLYEAL